MQCCGRLAVIFPLVASAAYLGEDGASLIQANAHAASASFTEADALGYLARFAAGFLGEQGEAIRNFTDAHAVPADSAANLMAESSDHVEAGHPRQPVLCTSEDKSMLSQLMMRGNGAAAAIASEPSCSALKVVTPFGLSPKHLGECMQASQKISAPCSTCHVKLFQGLLGKNFDRGCRATCDVLPAFCQIPKARECRAATSDCLQCARPHLGHFLQCVGLPFEKFAMNIYDQVVDAEREGTVEYPETMAAILAHALPDMRDADAAGIVPLQ